MQPKPIDAESQAGIQTRRANPQRILPVGRVFSLAGDLAQRFPGWSADFWFASSRHAAGVALRQQGFDLTLSEFRLPDGWASRMIPRLGGSSDHLFGPRIVEAGGRWFLMVKAGRTCDMAPPLRRSAFFRLLREQIELSGDLSADARHPSGDAIGYSGPTSSSGRKEPIREQGC